MSQFVLVGVVALVLLLGIAVAAYRWGYDQGQLDAVPCSCEFCASVPEQWPDPDGRWVG